MMLAAAVVVVAAALSVLSARAELYTDVPEIAYLSVDNFELFVPSLLVMSELRWKGREMNDIPFVE